MSNMPLVAMLGFVILRHTRVLCVDNGGNLAGFHRSIGSCSDIFIGTDFQLVVQGLNGLERAFEGLSFSLIDQFNHARGVQTARDIQWINEKTPVSFRVFQRNRPMTVALQGAERLSSLIVFLSNAFICNQMDDIYGHPLGFS